MAEQAPGGIVYDGEHTKLGVSDEAVKQIGATIQHVSDRFFDTFDRHPDAVVVAIALAVLAIYFQAKRVRDKLMLSKELKELRGAPPPQVAHQPQSQLTTSRTSRQLPRGKNNGP